MKITRVDDEKVLWKKTYYRDEEETRETRVAIAGEEHLFTAFGSAGMMPDRPTGTLAAFSLGVRFLEDSWGSELDGGVTGEGDPSFHLLVIKGWPVNEKHDLFWLGAGATYLTASRESGFGGAARAGYDKGISRQWIAGGFLGVRFSGPYPGLEAGLRVGFIF
jgi:hypothetical protein